METNSITEIKKTGAQWELEYPNFDILKADGWNESGGSGQFPNQSSFETLEITREEFEYRVADCTCSFNGPYEHWFDRKQSKQVIVFRKDLKVRKGKMCSQVAHASLAAYKIADREDKSFISWDECLFTKIVLGIDNEEKLLELYNKIKDTTKLNVVLITDSGQTEFNGIPTNTCIGIGPNWSDEIDVFTKELSLM